MDSENKQFVLKVDNELVISMPLNKMFLDPDVRKLAQYAGEGNLTKLDELVKQGVNVNSSGNQGATPLFWALRNENFSGFKRLLELGADPNIVFRFQIVKDYFYYFAMSPRRSANHNLFIENGLGRIASIKRQLR